MEENLAKGVKMMKRCMNLKVRAKNLLRTIDKANAEKNTQQVGVAHTGYVKLEIFF